MRYIKRYDIFLEDGGAAAGGGVACANASTTAGMGAVSSAQPGAVAGTTGTTGSGDIGFVLGYDPKKKRKKGNPRQVSDLRDLKDAKTNKVKESIDEGSEEYEDIRWALIDFMDQGFDLSVNKYDNPEDIKEMKIAMKTYMPADEDVVTGNNEIKGVVEDGRMEELKVRTIFNPTELKRDISWLKGKDREWTESLESACLRLIDLEGYDHASFRIYKTRIASSDNVSVNIHIHLMKNPE